jgi:hypothetical protein
LLARRPLTLAKAINHGMGSKVDSKGTLATC